MKKLVIGLFLSILLASCSNFSGGVSAGGGSNGIGLGLDTGIRF